MTASSVASVSLDPPLVLVSVARDNDMHPALKAADRFVVNVLAADQEAISRRFAEEHPNRFDGIGYSETRHGLPVREGVLARIACEKQAEAPGGDPAGVLRRGQGRRGVRPRPVALRSGWVCGAGGRGGGEPMIGNELLDDPRADPVAVGKELHDIARLNALFGGTRAVVAALDTVFRAARDAGCETRDARWTLLDIGTGAGDIPRAAVAAAARYGITLSPIGVEVIPAAARLARRSGVAAVIADANGPPPAPKAAGGVAVGQVLPHLPRARAVRCILPCDGSVRRPGGLAGPA